MILQSFSKEPDKQFSSVAGRDHAVEGDFCRQPASFDNPDYCPVIIMYVVRCK